MSRAISFGERVQNLDRLRAVKGVIELFAGSSSDAYIQARWREVQRIVDIDQKPVDLPVVGGDPRTSLLAERIIYRWKKRAAVVAAARIAIDSILDEYPEGQMGVGIGVDGEHHVGVLPKNVRFRESDRNYSAGVRRGRGDFLAGLVIWLPDKEIAIAPREQEILIPDIHVDQLKPPNVLV